MARPDPYQRRRERAGFVYPTQQEREVQWSRRFERRLIPKDALVLGHDPTDGRGVYFRPDQLKTHLHVFGGSQSGKTNLLKLLAAELLKHHKRTGEGFAVIDPHGPLAGYVLELCVKEGLSFADRVTYFDLRQERKVPVLNPLRREFDVSHAARDFMEALAKMEGRQHSRETPLISQQLKNAAKVLLHNELSLAEAEFFMTNSPEDLEVRESLLAAVPATLAKFWRKIASLPVKEREVRTESAARRLEDLLDVPTLRRIVGQSEVGISLYDVMEKGEIAIFDLSVHDTAVPFEVQHFLGALLVQQFRSAALRRDATGGEPRPFYVLADEFGEYVSHDVIRMLTAVAKFGLRFVLAHQDLGQLMLSDQDRRLLGTVLGIPNKVNLGQGEFGDQVIMARETEGAWVDLDKPKAELRDVRYRPVQEKVILHGGSHPDGPTESISESLDSNDSTRRTTTQGRSETPGVSTWREQMVTRHEVEERVISQQFASFDELVDRKAQELKKMPLIDARVTVTRNPPQWCRLAEAPDPNVPEMDCVRFLELVEEKACYLTPQEADERIRERRTRLLASAKGNTEPPAARFAPSDRWEPETGTDG